MGNYDFDEDIHIGESGEKVVVEDLKSMGCKNPTYNKDNKYDVKIETPDGKFVTYEIKTDVWCVPASEITLPNGTKLPIKAKDNGNLFIEFECRGKPSGIAVTKANFFVTNFQYYNAIWYIKTSDLKKLIEDNNFETMEFSGDMDSNTKGYLIPRKKYQKHFIIRTKF